MIVLLYCIAPLIARFYSNPDIVSPLRVYSLSLVFNVVKSIAYAKLQKEMMFKQMMLSNIIASIISGTVGVYMAYEGYGIWALITYYFSSTIITTTLYINSTRWYPKLIFSIQRAKTLFHFGWKMLVSGMLCSVYNDMRSLIIGKVYSPAELGYYNRGEQFPLIISQTLDGAIQAVMFPVMSSVQDINAQVREVLRRTFSTGVLIIVPIMLALTIMARPIIELLLTSKWMPAVPYMQCICIGCTTIPMTSSFLVAIKSIGRSDVYMKLEVVRRLSMLIILLISVFGFRSVIAIAIGYALSSWLDYFIISFVVRHLFDYEFKKQCMDVWQQFLAAIFMCIAIFAVGLIPMPNLYLLLSQIFVGVLSYIGFCYVFKIQSFVDLLSLVVNKTRQ